MSTKSNSYAYSVFEKLCTERNVTPYQVSIGTNGKVSTSVLSQWKAGLFELKLDKLVAIAEFFNEPVTIFIKN